MLFPKTTSIKLSVWRVELDHDYGYGYVRVFLVKRKGTNGPTHVIIEPLSTYQSIDEVYSVDSLSEELLFPPMLSFVVPEIESERYWRYAGDYYAETYNVPPFFSSQLIDYGNVSLYDSSL